MTSIPMIAELYEPDLSTAESRPNRAIEMPVPTDEAAYLSLEQLRDGIRRRFDRLWALDVEYVFNVESYCEDPRIVPFGRFRYAFQNEKRLKSQSNIWPDGKGFNPDHIWAWNGHLQQDFQAASKHAFVKAVKAKWNDNDSYSSFAGVPTGPPGDGINAFKNHYVRVLLKRRFFPARHFKVLPILERVDGATCHVIESSDGTKFWIDSQHNCAVRFMAFKNVWRVALRDYRCMAEGIWLPWRIENVVYDSKTLEPSINEAARATAYIVKSMAVNEEVRDDMFDLKYPPGTQVFDTVHKRSYRLGEYGEEINLGDMN